MQHVSTGETFADAIDERHLACHEALAQIDYLNFFMEQRVAECVLRNEKACRDMLKALDQVDTAFHRRIEPS